MTNTPANRHENLEMLKDRLGLGRPLAFVDVLCVLKKQFCCSPGVTIFALFRWRYSMVAAVPIFNAGSHDDHVPFPQTFKLAPL